ncbi:MAG: magnesium/cobalt transporter CorA [Gemmatimonas sp.]|nr:magnesium/cobalt transporter CorA [Gemmatimonas sp.]
MGSDQNGPKIRCYAGDGDTVQAIDKDEAAARVRQALATSPPADTPSLTWIDVLSPTAEEAAFLRDRALIHPLAVEDCLRGRQRPKIDRYDNYSFLVVYTTQLNLDRERMALNEVHLFIGPTFFITVHDKVIPEVDELLAEWCEDPARFNDSGTVAHAVLDAITDNYFPVIEHFSDYLAKLEEGVFSGLAESSIEQALRFRRELVLLRRVLAPQRDVLSSFLRRDLPFVHPELIPYFQNVHDHILRVAEEIDTFRELVAGLMEVNSGNSANQLNRTMQTLTGWSIILMSMALIAGIYGMNFVFMPELRWRWGYLFALITMLVTGAALLRFFRKRGWL